MSELEVPEPALKFTSPLVRSRIEQLVAEVDASFERVWNQFDWYRSGEVAVINKRLLVGKGRKGNRQDGHLEIKLSEETLGGITARCGSQRWAEAWLVAEALGHTVDEFASPDYDCELCPHFGACLLDGRIRPT